MGVPRNTDSQGKNTTYWYLIVLLRVVGCLPSRLPEMSYRATDELGLT